MVFNNFVTPSVWEHVDGSSAIEAGFSQKSAGAWTYVRRIGLISYCQKLNKSIMKYLQRFWYLTQVFTLVFWRCSVKFIYFFLNVCYLLIVHI